MAVLLNVITYGDVTHIIMWPALSYGIANVTKISKVFLQVQTDLRAVFKSTKVMLHF